MQFEVDGDVDYLAGYLTSEGIHEDVVEDIATVIGDRIALHNILHKAQKV